MGTPKAPQQPRMGLPCIGALTAGLQLPPGRSPEGTWSVRCQASFIFPVHSAFVHEQGLPGICCVPPSTQPRQGKA